MSKVTASSGVDPDAFLRQFLDGATAGLGRSDAERAVWEVSIDAARAGLKELAAAPLSVELSWPAGVTSEQRETIVAQLHYELQRTAIARLATEARLLLTLAPGIALGLAARLGDPQAQQMAGRTIAKLTAPPSLAQRISSALRRK